MSRLLIGVCCIALACSTAWAGEDQAATPEQVAATYKEAFERKDAAAQAVAVLDRRVDAWLIVDELCRLGAHGAAAAFTDARREDVEALQAYIAAQRSRPYDNAAHAAITEIYGKLRRGYRDAAEAQLQNATVDLKTIGGVRLLHMRALILRSSFSKDFVDAANRAAAAAEQLGWLRLAGHTYYDLGHNAFHSLKYDIALAAYSNALRIVQQRGDRKQFASILHNLGNVHGRLGADAQALVLYERALRLRRELGDQEPLAATLIDLGNLLGRTRGLTEAEPLLEEGLRLARAVGKKLWISNALEGLGHVRSSRGEWDESAALHKESAEIRMELGDQLAIASSIQNLAAIHRNQDKFKQALDGFRLARKLRESRRDRAGVAKLLSLMGEAHAAAGELDEAHEHFEQGRKLAQELGHDELVAELSLGIGQLHLLRDEHSAAREAFEQAAKLSARPLARAQASTKLATLHFEASRFMDALATAGRAVTSIEVFASNKPSDGARARHRLREAYEIGVRAALECEDLDALAWFLECNRARSLLMRLSGRKALASVILPSALRQGYTDAQRAVREARAAAHHAGLASERTELRQKRKALRAAEERLLVSASRLHSEAMRMASLVEPAPVPLKQIQAVLAPHQALILYGIERSHVVAAVLTSTKARAVRLGTIHDGQGALSDRCGATDELAAAIVNLRAQLVAPLELGAKIDSVLVSPVGWLQHVPFGALFSQPVALTPSGSVHVLLSQEKARGAGVLALGDPAYVKGDRLTALPETRAEAESIGDVALIGEEASETALFDQLAKRARWRAIHFACHGLLDEKRPRLSSLALAPDEKNDGRLTVLEIEHTHMPAGLVTLAATNSARGNDVADGTRAGLVPAFLTSGATRVIGSLWCMDSQAASALMLRFYELWAPNEPGGLGAAEALQKAQEHVRTQPKWKHPYYWAGWTLWGLPN